jgi:hypothetical protein
MRNLRFLNLSDPASAAESRAIQKARKPWLAGAISQLTPLLCLAAVECLPVQNASAESISDANATMFGPNVYVFNTNMSNSDIQNVLTNVWNQMQTNQFGSQGYAFLFKPGTYNVDCNVGFYTSVAGLGQNPDNVVINGGVNCNAAWNNGEALDNFWRSVENFAVQPTANDSNTFTVPGITRFAVSQAAPIRRLHVEGELDLYDRWPSCQCGAGYASGGFLADSKIDGNVAPASQQQWLSRNSTWAAWNNAVWNMVFVGCNNAPANTFPSPAYTTISNTPVIREKPYLYVDGSGNFNVFVPALESNTAGISWGNGSTPGTSVPISQFYIANPASDTASTINSALSSGKNILFTPGTYALNGTLMVNNANTILMGLGFPALKAANGQPVISVADVDGVSIASMIIDAGPQDSPVLLQVGRANSTANHSANPTVLYDLTVRTGGVAAAQDDVGVVINSSNVIMDNVWIWRADHGNGVGWTSNPSQNGLIVNGNNVTCYGLFNEHHEQYQTLWNGNGGRVYMYQSEIPYDVPSQSAWIAPGGQNGYSSYKVANNVTSHGGWGLGVYCYFLDAPAVLANAIETPNRTGDNFYDMTTIWLGYVGGSEIANIIDNVGGQVSDSGSNFQKTLTQFIGNGSGSAPSAPSLSINTNSANPTLTWSAVSGASSYNVKRSTVSGGEITIANTGSTSFTDNNVAANTTYYYVVSAVVNGGGYSAESGNSAEVSTGVTNPVQLPPGWADSDLGNPGVAGTANYQASNGAWTVSGGGSDIWNNSDQFNFASEAVTGSNTLIAEVTGITNTDIWAKAGVMLRDTSAAGSAFVDVVATESNGVSLQWRSAANGACGFIQVAGVPAPSASNPVWVELIQNGNSFAGYYATNGVPWTYIGSTNVTFSSSTNLAGLAVTAHNNALLNKSTFASVSVVPTGWADFDLGSPGIGGSAIYSEQLATWSVSGGGADIWNQSDQFNFASESLTGDGAFVVGITNIENSDVWTKVGAMFRDSGAANSMFVDLVGTPSGGVSLQWRNATGGSASYVVTWGLPAPSASNPLWLKLIKHGTTYTGYYSISGSAWTLVGSTNVSFSNSNFEGGLAVTAHNNSLLNTSTFVYPSFYPGEF